MNAVLSALGRYCHLGRASAWTRGLALAVMLVCWGGAAPATASAQGYGNNGANYNYGNYDPYYYYYFGTYYTYAGYYFSYGDYYSGYYYLGYAYLYLYYYDGDPAALDYYYSCMDAADYYYYYYGYDSYY